MVLTIRPARHEDAAEAAVLLNAIIRKGGTTAIETEMTAAAITDLFLVSDYVACCHVATQEGRLLGFQSVGRNQKLPQGWGDMASFAAQDAVGQGIGTALFQATLAATRAMGLDYLNATIRADNRSGLGYYRRMGFTDYRILRALPLADGRRVDRHQKRLNLTA